MTGKETNGADAGAGEGSARRANLPKRFYKDVSVKDEGGETAPLLDGKPVRTPGKAPLALPTRALPTRSPRSGARKATASTPRPCR